MLDDGIKLNWQTATEVNNYRFEVERQLTVDSDQLSEWEKIGFVEGSGNSNSPKEYEYIDETAPSGDLEYRLKQIDTDGSYEYYNITAKVDNNITAIKDAYSLPTEYALEQNFPNPFNPTTVVKYSVPELSKVKIEIFNMLGQRIGVIADNVSSTGIYELSWNAESLPSGIYLISISAEGLESNIHFSDVKKAILLK